MTGYELTKAEAEALIAMEKHRADDEVRTYPAPGQQVKIGLVSASRREKFFLAINRKSIDLRKRSYLTLGRQVVVLVRLDYGAPHRNPDGQEVPSPHLHRYVVGYADKWAEAVPEDAFPNITEPWLALTKDFMQYCNITRPPKIERGLFA